MPLMYNLIGNNKIKVNVSWNIMNTFAIIIMQVTVLLSLTVLVWHSDRKVREQFNINLKVLKVEYETD